LKRPAGAAGEIAWELIRFAWSSRAALAIVPLQDLLNLGAEARMNQPGRAEGNWRWRCTDAMLSAPIFRDLAHLTETADRVGALHPPRVERPSAR
jgi:4-alpha-glucanotransferase